MHSLKEGSGYIDPDQRHAVAIQFLQCIDAPATATFFLRSVDHLPCLVMALLDAVVGIVKVEENRHEHGEASHVFQDLEEAPTAKKKCHPVPHPLECEEGNAPGGHLPLPLMPGLGSLAR